MNGTITTAGHTVTTAEAGKPLPLTVEETLTNVADGDAVTVWYTVTREGSTAKDSDEAGYTVSVTTISLRVMGSRSNLSCYFPAGGITTQYFRDTAPHRLLHVSAGGETVTLNRINVAHSLSSVAARTDAGRVMAWGDTSGNAEQFRLLSLEGGLLRRRAVTAAWAHALSPSSVQKTIRMLAR